MRRSLPIAAGLLAASFCGFLLLPAASRPAVVPVADTASADYFLKIDGVEGESSDARHKNEIDIESFSWGASQPGIADGSGGAQRGGGKVSFQDFHFLKLSDKASPVLFLATAEGKHFPTATLTVRKAGAQQDYMKIKLTDILVSSYKGEGKGDVPMDSFSINYAKIEYEVSATGADGSASAPVKAGWDVKANKKI